MRSLTQKALWPYDQKCWSSLFRFCDKHGRTLMRPVVKYHASSDFQGGLTNELTETHTTESCGYGFTFGNYALRQGDSNESFWEIVQDYLGQEKVLVEIRSWDDLASSELDAVLAEAVIKAKEEYRARIDKMLASLPEPEAQPKPKPEPEVDHDLIDWNEYDEDDTYWG